ncbi:MAG: hypothetical protein Ct9H300mP29_4310 [Candidatus Neomarinimicrobiota bacterium]|nr:MAG: hypothetical protein Ct9H300mP29_4310 [Candidatus Neomarinimicrobiota bacterium]
MPWFDTVILGVGPLVFDGLNAAEKMDQSGISCEVVNCRFIKPWMKLTLNQLLEKFYNVVTIEGKGEEQVVLGKLLYLWVSRTDIRVKHR